MVTTREAEANYWKGGIVNPGTHCHHYQINKGVHPTYL